MNELKNFLKDYKSKEGFKNISELDVICVEDMKEINWRTDEFPDDEDSEKMKSVRRITCKIKDDEIIIPFNVMDSLKTFEESDKVGSVKKFIVAKSGSGKLTKYSLIPVEFYPID